VSNIHDDLLLNDILTVLPRPIRLTFQIAQTRYMRLKQDELIREERNRAVELSQLGNASFMPNNEPKRKSLFNQHRNSNSSSVSSLNHKKQERVSLLNNNNEVVKEEEEKEKHAVEVDVEVDLKNKLEDAFQSGQAVEPTSLPPQQAVNLVLPTEQKEDADDDQTEKGLSASSVQDEEGEEVGQGDSSEDEGELDSLAAVITAKRTLSTAPMELFYRLDTPPHKSAAPPSIRNSTDSDGVLIKSRVASAASDVDIETLFDFNDDAGTGYNQPIGVNGLTYGAIIEAYTNYVIKTNGEHNRNDDRINIFELIPFLEGLIGREISTSHMIRLVEQFDENLDNYLSLVEILKLFWDIDFDEPEMFELGDNFYEVTYLSDDKDNQLKLKFSETCKQVIKGGFHGFILKEIITNNNENGKDENGIQGMLDYDDETPLEISDCLIAINGAPTGHLKSQKELVIKCLQLQKPIRFTFQMSKKRYKKLKDIQKQIVKDEYDRLEAAALKELSEMSQVSFQPTQKKKSLFAKNKELNSSKEAMISDKNDVNNGLLSDSEKNNGEGGSTNIVDEEEDDDVGLNIGWRSHLVRTELERLKWIKSRLKKLLSLGSASSSSTNEVKEFSKSPSFNERCPKGEVQLLLIECGVILLSIVKKKVIERNDDVKTLLHLSCVFLDRALVGSGATGTYGNIDEDNVDSPSNHSQPNYSRNVPIDMIGIKRSQSNNNRPPLGFDESMNESFMDESSVNMSLSSIDLKAASTFIEDNKNYWVVLAEAHSLYYAVHELNGEFIHCVRCCEAYEHARQENLSNVELWLSSLKPLIRLGALDAATIVCGIIPDLPMDDEAPSKFQFIAGELFANIQSFERANTSLSACFLDEGPPPPLSQEHLLFALGLLFQKWAAVEDGQDHSSKHAQSIELFSQAYAISKQTNAVNSDDVQSWLCTGQTWRSYGDMFDIAGFVLIARDCYDKAVNSTKGDLATNKTAWFLLAKSSYRCGRWQEAREALISAQKVSKNNQTFESLLKTWSSYQDVGFDGGASKYEQQVRAPLINLLNALPIEGVDESGAASSIAASMRGYLERKDCSIVSKPRTSSSHASQVITCAAVVSSPPQSENQANTSTSPSSPPPRIASQVVEYLDLDNDTSTMTTTMTTTTTTTTNATESIANQKLLDEDAARILAEKQALEEETKALKEAMEQLSDQLSATAKERDSLSIQNQEFIEKSHQEEAGKTQVTTPLSSNAVASSNHVALTPEELEKIKKEIELRVKEEQKEEAKKLFEEERSVLKKEVETAQKLLEAEKQRVNDFQNKIEATKKVEDTEKVEETKQVKDIEKAEETEKVEETKQVKDIEKAEETEKVEETKQVKDIEKAEETEKVEETKQVKDIEKDSPAEQVVEQSSEVNGSELQPEVNRVVEEISKSGSAKEEVTHLETTLTTISPTTTPPSSKAPLPSWSPNVDVSTDPQNEEKENQDRDSAATTPTLFTDERTLSVNTSSRVEFEAKENERLLKEQRMRAELELKEAERLMQLQKLQEKEEQEQKLEAEEDVRKLKQLKLENELRIKEQEDSIIMRKVRSKEELLLLEFRNNDDDNDQNNNSLPSPQSMNQHAPFLKEKKKSFTPEELDERLLDMFGGLDLNQDGMCSRTELEKAIIEDEELRDAVLESCGFPRLKQINEENGSDIDFDAMFAIMDCDKNGWIDFAEFKEFVGRRDDLIEKAKQGLLQSDEYDDGYSKGEALKALFAAVDRNGDGDVTRGELLRALNNDERLQDMLVKLLGIPKKVANMNAKIAFGMVFDCLDTDGTHTISLDEMQTFIEDMDHIIEMRNDANLPPQVQALLTAADKNNDGTLSQIEIIRALNDDPKLRVALTSRKEQVKFFVEEARALGCDAVLPSHFSRRIISGSMDLINSLDVPRSSTEESLSLPSSTTGSEAGSRPPSPPAPNSPPESKPSTAQSIDTQSRNGGGGGTKARRQSRRQSRNNSSSDSISHPSSRTQSRNVSVQDDTDTISNLSIEEDDADSHHSLSPTHTNGGGNNVTFSLFKEVSMETSVGDDDDDDDDRSLSDSERPSSSASSRQQAAALNIRQQKVILSQLQKSYSHKQKPKHEYQDLQNELIAYVTNKKIRHPSIWSVNWLGDDTHSNSSNSEPNSGKRSASSQSSRSHRTHQREHHHHHDSHSKTQADNIQRRNDGKFPTISVIARNKRHDGSDDDEYKYNGNNNLSSFTSGSGYKNSKNGKLQETEEERKERLKKERIKKRQQKQSVDKLANLDFRSTRQDTIDAKIMNTMMKTPNAVPCFFPQISSSSQRYNNDQTSVLSHGSANNFYNNNDDNTTIISQDYSTTFPSYSGASGNKSIGGGDRSIMTGMSTSSAISYDKVKVVKVDHWGTDRSQAKRRRNPKTANKKNQSNGGFGPTRHKPVPFNVALEQERLVKEAGINMQFQKSVLNRKQKSSHHRDSSKRSQDGGGTTDVWSLSDDDNTGRSLESPVRGINSTYAASSSPDNIKRSEST